MAWNQDISGMDFHQDWDFHRWGKMVVLSQECRGNNRHTTVFPTGHIPHNGVGTPSQLLPKLVDKLDKPDFLA
jgi:hypothetical protein